MTKDKKKYVAWLQNAYAMEVDLSKALEGHLKLVAEYPDMQEKIQEHLELTAEHAEKIKSVLDRHGEDVSKLKSTMGSLTGMMKSFVPGSGNEQTLNIAKAEYVSEQFEVACYTALSAAAEYMDDEETIKICEDILSDEEMMAEFLEENIPMLAEDVLGEKAADDNEDENT